MPVTPRVARTQHGVFSRAQARLEGFDYRTVSRRIRDGVWTELLTDAFALTSTEATPRVMAQAAVLATGGVVSHQTAAAIHEFDHRVPRSADGLHVTMEPRTHAVV